MQRENLRLLPKKKKRDSKVSCIHSLEVNVNWGSVVGVDNGQGWNMGSFDIKPHILTGTDTLALHQASSVESESLT